MKHVRPRRLIAVLAISSLLLLAADLLLHHHTPDIGWPNFSLFVAISLIGNLLFIALALFIAPLIQRREDYYDR